MREADIERELVERVRAAGGACYKWVSPGNAGVPDRIVIMPGGRVWFVELKTDTGQLRPLQKRQLSRLRALGCDLAVLRGMEGLEEFMGIAQ